MTHRPLVGTLLGFNMAVAGNTSNAGIIDVLAMLVCGGLGLKLARSQGYK